MAKSEDDELRAFRGVVVGSILGGLMCFFIYWLWHFAQRAH